MFIIYVSGGGLSGLGKGVAAASIASLIKTELNLKIEILKIDGYLNKSAGDMRACEHGEVFVTECGKETDLDLGHYERFTGQYFSDKNSITMGQIYRELFKKVDEGEFIGKTIQMIPHVIDHLSNKINEFSDKTDVLIIEIGGTVGDIESDPILKTITQLKYKSIHVHLSKLDFEIGSIKTRIIQFSLAELMKRGIIPDIVICRSYKKLTDEDKLIVKNKLNGQVRYVLFGETLEYIYDIPKYYQGQNILNIISSIMGVPYNNNKTNFTPRRINGDDVNICIGAKYTGADSYLSIEESLKHVMYKENININIDFIDLNRNFNEYKYNKYNGIIIPGGFGTSAIENKISLIKYARENKIPILGLCLGMQLMCIEYARNKCGLKNATSEEFDHILNGSNIISLMNDQNYRKTICGTMRLGAYECNLMVDSKSYSIYGTPYIQERHRHRYEFNNAYKDILKENGMLFTGYNMKFDLVEIIELSTETHPFFIGTQFHPEYKSTPDNPHPLFREFVKEIVKIKKDTGDYNDL